MILTFDTKGNDKQKECAKAWLNDEITEIVYGGSKGSAKSFTGCKLIFHDALVYDGTFYFIARKKLNDLRKFTIPSIYECFEDWGLKVSDYMTYNGQDSFFQLTNGSRVYLLDAAYMPSDPLYQRFGSMQFTRGWIEEAGEFEEAAKSNLAASIGRWLNDKYKLVPKLLQTCNPSKNYLYLDYKANKEGKLERYKKFIQALPTDNKCLPKGYLENLNRVLSKSQKERLLYGNWEYDDDPLTMMGYDKILELYTNEFIETGTMYMTCDIAYEGSDIFVIMVWNGLQVVKIIANDKISEVAVPKWINEHRIKYNVPLGNVIYDADGIKKFVRQSASAGTLNGAREFHNNGKPVDDAYFNLKSECYFKAAEYVNANKIFIKDNEYRDQFIQEAEQIRKIEHADDGKLRVEKKADLKERLKRSPDFWDAFAMRMFWELKPKFTPYFGGV